MIKALITDFSRVLLSPTDENYAEGLNALHKKLSVQGDYDFWKHFRLNQDLLAFYKTLAGLVELYVFTTETIQEHPALQPKMAGIFKAIFSAARLGLKKNDPRAYEAIAKKINLKPGEILYIDDKQSNLDVAQKTGMVVIRYQSNGQTIKDIIGELACEAI